MRGGNIATIAANVIISLIVGENQTVLELTRNSIRQILPWAFLEIPYQKITKAEGIYTIIRPPDSKLDLPVVTFSAIEIGSRIILTVSDELVYKVNFIERTIEICGPEKLTAALREGKLEKAKATA